MGEEMPLVNNSCASCSSVDEERETPSSLQIKCQLVFLLIFLNELLLIERIDLPLLHGVDLIVGCNLVLPTRL